MRNPSTSTSTTTKTPCCSKVGLKRGPWTPEEDELLASYINKEGEGRWRTLPKRAGLLRCGKSCRLRWMNYLRPSVKRGQIAPDEEDLILRLHRLLGNRWSLIAGRIPGRTDNEIKNYWNTHLSKKLISQGIDPRTHKPLAPESVDQLINAPSSSAKATKKSNLINEEPSRQLASNSGLGDEDNSGNNTEMVITDKEKEKEKEQYFFQYCTTTFQQLDDQYQTDDIIARHGYTSLLNYNGCFGMDNLRAGNNNQRLAGNEVLESEDINAGSTDDMFSFLNSIINEEAFTTSQQQHHQVNIQQQVPTGMIGASHDMSSSDPSVPIGAATTSFGLSTAAGWEPALMSSSFNHDDHNKG